MNLFGLVGKNLSHSFSPRFFKKLFVEKNISAEYKTFEISDISLIKQVFDLQPKGLNVTIPYKETIIPFLDDLDEIARKISAVNTICFEDKRIIGRNTDVIGFKRMLQPFLTSKHERAVVFGTGGAAKAVNHVLEQIGVDVIFISRNFDNRENFFRYQDVNSQMLKSCKLLINTTPVGMYPHINNQIALPYNELTEEHLVVDLIYNPEETMFLKYAKENGAQILNGTSMLSEQALESWLIWNK